MTRIRTTKTTFTGGEIGPSLLGRGDLRGYANGARTLRNVLVSATGGVSRRPGLRHVRQAEGPGRLVAFEFNTEQTYLLAFSDLRIDVYAEGGWLASFAAPWTAAQLPQIAWTQSADTLFVCHPDVAPRRITRTSDVAWTVAELAYLAEDAHLRQPYYRFAPEDRTLAASATTGTVTLTASAAVFEAGHVGTRFRLQGAEIVIGSVSSATAAQGEAQEALFGTSATKDWDEAAFSPVRGWPVTVAFHQDRLAFGGSRSLPDRIWMSKTADWTHFGLGEGLDDDAIEFALLSDQVNAVRAVHSGRHLQVFTSGAEWMVSGEPLTPKTVQARRQTRIGSRIDRHLPPRSIDGATLFAPRDGQGLREFLYTDLEQAYVSADLALLSRHLFDQPVDHDFDDIGRHLHIVMADGSIATLTLHRAEQVAGWTGLATDGAFRSVAAVGDAVYALVERAGAWSVELFDPALNTDAALLGSSETPETVWSGLDHLEGRTVAVVADGAQREPMVVSGGAVELDAPALKVEIGLPFAHEIEPLPPYFEGPAPIGTVRLIKATFRLEDTQALRADLGRGFRDLPFRTLGDDLLDRPTAPFTGDKSARGLGWRRSPARPLWRIVQDAPLPFTLLSVTTDLKVND
jgi:hypothetical protein